MYVCKDTDIETFLLQASVEPTATDCKDLNRLQNLSKTDIFIVTDPKLMRRVDYRVAKHTRGISLLIMSDFDSKRSYVQGLGRVGRYNEDSRRFIWEQLAEPVNKKKETAMFAKLKAALDGARKPGNKKQKQDAKQSTLSFSKDIVIKL